MTRNVLTPEIEFKVKGYECYRCKHRWQRRRKDEGTLPIECPKCKSPYWNKPRKQKK